MNSMKSNPFLPAAALTVERQQMNRERVKLGVYAVLLAHLVLVMGLLIEGCKRDDTSSAAGTPAPETATAQTNQPPVAEIPAETKVAEPPTAATLPTLPPAISEAAPAPVPVPAVAPLPANQPAVAKADSFYVVKSGDALSRIAKAQHTTIKALKAVNGLKTDRIVTGQKLKLSVPVLAKTVD